MLKVEGIDLHYGAAQALRSVSIEARQGEVTCILGRNGVGKTSLLRGIVGHQKVSAGRVVWNGEDINGLAAYERARRGIAFVPQGREIFPLLTVKENLETGFAPIKRKDRSIPDEIFELFPVLRSMLRRRGGDLSGGQQQQLAIARALVTRPGWSSMSRPRASSRPSSRISAAPSPTCGSVAQWPLCWWSSTSSSRGISPTGLPSWIEARS
jgi:urea transport system ATP-binding protein